MEASPSLPTSRQVSWVIEESGGSSAAWRAYIGTCVTLTLGVLGSAILPMPFAISKTGVLVGLLTMLLVAGANDATSCMLIRAAAITGHTSYEALAEWAGGWRWKLFAQASLIMLLWGTMCGGVALMHDVAEVMVFRAYGSDAPSWLTASNCTLLVAVLVLFPLCVQRHISQLEAAATAGVTLVLGLVVVLGIQAYAEGFPALASGELPLWSLQVDSHLPEAFAILGYAFYMQPMMMPMLSELRVAGGGTAAMRVMRATTHTVLYGIAFAIFFSMSVFGASLYGQHTEGNILLNDIVAGRAISLITYGLMLVYLALGMTTTQYPLRSSIDALLLGPNAPFTWVRQISLTAAIVGSSTAIALLFPRASEKILAVVGASAVCLVCYVIPVYIQLVLFARSRAAGDERRWPKSAAAAPDALAPLLGEAASGDHEAQADGAPLIARAPSLLRLHLPRDCGVGSRVAAAVEEGVWGAERLQLLVEVVLPVGIMLLGVGFSIAALYVAVKPLLNS